MTADIRFVLRRLARLYDWGRCLRQLWVPGCPEHRVFPTSMLLPTDLLSNSFGIAVV